MTKWEYRVELVPHRDGTYSSSIHIHPEDLDALLDKLGAEGWELCETGTGSIIVLKRPLGPEEPPQWLLDLVADVRGKFSDIRTRLEHLETIDRIQGWPRRDLA